METSKPPWDQAWCSEFLLPPPFSLCSTPQPDSSVQSQIWAPLCQPPRSSARATFCSGYHTSLPCLLTARLVHFAFSLGPLHLCSLPPLPCGCFPTSSSLLKSNFSRAFPGFLTRNFHHSWHFVSAFCGFIFLLALP